MVVVQRHLGLLSEEEEEEREEGKGSRQREVKRKKGKISEQEHARVKIRIKRNAVKMQARVRNISNLEAGKMRKKSIYPTDNIYKSEQRLTESG